MRFVVFRIYLFILTFDRDTLKMGIAKRRHYERRVKSSKLTQIHSNFRRFVIHTFLFLHLIFKFFLISFHIKGKHGHFFENNIIVIGQSHHP